MEANISHKKMFMEHVVTVIVVMCQVKGLESRVGSYWYLYDRGGGWEHACVRHGGGGGGGLGTCMCQAQCVCGSSPYAQKLPFIPSSNATKCSLLYH